MLSLGRTRLEAGGRPLASDWLSHRPGLVLKYLAAERGRVVPLEELMEVFWPPRAAAGPRTCARRCTRCATGWSRATRGPPSSFVLARHGGYELAPGRVWIDADDFEAHARTGLEALERGADRARRRGARRGRRRLRGDFLADEPYAEWALPERERLRDLAGQVLRALAGLRRAADDADGAPSTSSASPSSSR